MANLINESIKLGTPSNLNPLFKPVSAELYKQASQDIAQTRFNSLMDSIEIINEDKARTKFKVSQKRHNEIIDSFKDFYSDSSIDPNDEIERAMLANFLSKEYRSVGLGYDYFHDNMDSYFYNATGYKSNVKTYWEHLDNTFKSSALSYLSGMEMALTMVFNPSEKDNMLDKISRRATNYRRDLGDEKWDNIFHKMITASVAQAPNLIVSAGIMALGAIPGLPLPVVTALRIASSGLMEGGSTMLELAQAGADNNTILATGIAVGILNGSLETYGDDAILAPFAKVLKGNHKARSIFKDIWKDKAKDMAIDLVKGLATEIPTEITQEVVSMLGWNYAVEYEHRYGKMEDSIGYSASDFVTALTEVAKETALSTPLIVLGQDVVANGLDYIGGDWRKRINASKVTKATQNSQVLKSNDISAKESEKTKWLSKKELKKETPDPIQVVKVGNKFYARNTSDAQLSALKSSKYVNAEVNDFSVKNIVGEQVLSEQTAIEMGISYDKAIDSIAKGTQRGLTLGYSLLDEERNETVNPENAKYIAVATSNARDSAVIITLGNDNDIQSDFEKEVFGQVFNNITAKKADSKEENESNAASFEEYRSNIEKEREAMEMASMEDDSISMTDDKPTDEESQSNSDLEINDTQMQETQESTPTRQETLAMANEREDSFEQAVERITPDNAEEIIEVRDSILDESGDTQEAKDNANSVAISLATMAEISGNSVEETAKAITGDDIRQLAKAFSIDSISSPERIIDNISNILTSLPNKKLREKIRSAYNTKTMTKAVKSQIKSDLNEYLRTGKAKDGLSDFFAEVKEAIKATWEYAEPLLEERERKAGIASDRTAITELLADKTSAIDKAVAIAENSDKPNVGVLNAIKENARLKQSDEISDIRKMASEAPLSENDQKAVENNIEKAESLLSNLKDKAEHLESLTNEEEKPLDEIKAVVMEATSIESDIKQTNDEAKRIIATASLNENKAVVDFCDNQISQIENATSHIQGNDDLIGRNNATVESLNDARENALDNKGQETYSLAVESMDEFHDTVLKIAKLVGADDKDVILRSHLKSIERATEKVRTDYNGDWSRITDINGAMIMLESLEDAEKAYKKILGNKNINIYDYKHFKSSFGYEDYKIILEMSNGFKAELQLLDKDTAFVKTQGVGHTIYEHARQIEQIIDNRDGYSNVDDKTFNEIYEFYDLLREWSLYEYSNSLFLRKNSSLTSRLSYLPESQDGPKAKHLASLSVNNPLFEKLRAYLSRSLSEASLSITDFPSSDGSNIDIESGQTNLPTILNGVSQMSKYWTGILSSDGIMSSDTIVNQNSDDLNSILLKLEQETLSIDDMRLELLHELDKAIEAGNTENIKRIKNGIHMLGYRAYNELSSRSMVLTKGATSRIKSAFDSTSKNLWDIIGDERNNSNHLSIFTDMLKNNPSQSSSATFGEYAKTMLNKSAALVQELNNNKSLTNDEVKAKSVELADIRYSLCQIYDHQDILLDDKDISIDRKIREIGELASEDAKENYVFSGRKEKMESIMEDYVKPLYDTTATRLQSGDKTAMFQTALEDNSSTMASTEFNPFYEPYIYQKDGLYQFDEQLLAREINRQTEGAISQEESLYVASMLSLMPSHDIDAIIRKNNGRLIVNVSDSNINLGSQYRGASLINSAQIVLGKKSDVSTVIHESFHILMSIDQGLKNSIWEAVRESLATDGKALRDFIDNAKNVFPDGTDETIKKLALLEKENLTSEEQQNVEEAITSLYEAWFLNGESPSLSDKIKTLFKKLSKMFSKIYKTVVGKPFLPESIDVAFGATIDDSAYSRIMYQKDSNDTVNTLSENMKGTKMDDALGIATNIIFTRISDDISTLINNGDNSEAIIEKILASDKIKKYISSFNEEQQSLISKELSDKVRLITSSPTSFASRFNKDISKLESDIKKGKQTAQLKSAEKVLSTIADLWNSVRVKSTKSYEVFETQIRPYLNNYGDQKTYMLYERLVKSMRRKGEIRGDSFTPQEVLAMARALVEEDGSIILDERLTKDKGYRSPLITMLCYKVTDKTKINERNLSSIVDRRYLETTNLLIDMFQSPSNREDFAIDPAILDIADFIESSGANESWISYVSGKDVEMSIIAGIADMFQDNIDKINDRIASIRSENDSTARGLEAVLEVFDDIERRYKQIQKDKAKIENANNIKAELSNTRRRLNKLVAENEALAKAKAEQEENSGVASLQEEIASLKRSIHAYKGKVGQLQSGFDPRIAKLEKEIELLKDSDAYKATLQMKNLREKHISDIEKSFSGGDARIAKNLEDIFNSIKMKKGTKFDFNRFLQDQNNWNLLSYMLDRNIIKETNEGYTIERSTRFLSATELAELSDMFKDLKKKGIEIQKQRKEERQRRLDEKRSIIIDSLIRLNKLSKEQIDKFVNDYTDNIRPGSETYNDENKKNLLQKGMLGFTLTTKMVKHLSPALYSYMFGGIFDGSYNHDNLNSATDKEVQNIKNRSKGFIKKLSDTFKIDEKEISYAMKKLFKKNTSAIGTIDHGLLFNGIRNRDELDESLHALYNYRRNIEDRIERLEKRKESIKERIVQSISNEDIEEAYEQTINIDNRIKSLGDMLDDNSTSNAQYTIEQLMGIYIYAQSEDGINRLLKNDEAEVISQNLSYGNVLYVMNEFLTNDEFARYKEIADYIMEDVGSRYEEMAEVYYLAENKILKKEDMYFPISSMQGISQEGNPMPLEAYFGDRGHVNDRDTRERTGARHALNLEVIDSYMSAVNRQEHYIAFKLLTDEHTEMFKKDGRLAQAIKAIYQDKNGKGSSIVDQLYEYNEVIKGKTGNTSDYSRIISKIRNNFVTAKLWGNIATMLQQFPSYVLVARKVGWINAVKYLQEYISLGKNRSEMIYKLSPQMRNRARLDIETYKSERGNSSTRLEKWVERKFGKDILGDAKVGYRKFIDFGLSFMERADTAVANAMWFALYKKTLEDYSKATIDGKSAYNSLEEMQIAAATEATQQTMDLSPNSNVKDNALFYSNNDNFLRQMLLFTNQLNKQFNMIYGDIMNLEFNENIKEAVVPILEDLLVLGLVSASAAIISGTPYPDEDDEEQLSSFFAELFGYTLAEMAGNIPAVGSAIKDIATGTSYADTNLVEQINNLRKVLAKDTEDRTDNQLSRAVVNTFAEAGTLLGVPTTAVQKAYRTIINLSDEPSIGDAMYMINTKSGDFWSRIAE